ncbi:MAG: tetratricopeptide repeat protein [Chloroflexota bacterium]
MQVGEKSPIAFILSNLGSASRGLKRFDAALNYFAQSLPMTIEAADQRWIATNFNEIGQTYVEMGSYEQAIPNLLSGLNITMSIEAIPDALTSLTHLGRAAIQCNKMEAGLSWLVFVANQKVTPDLSKKEAESTLSKASGKISEQKRKQIVKQSQGVSIRDVKKSVEATLSDYRPVFGSK